MREIFSFLFRLDRGPRASHGPRACPALVTPAHRRSTISAHEFNREPGRQLRLARDRPAALAPRMGDAAGVGRPAGARRAGAGAPRGGVLTRPSIPAKNHAIGMPLTFDRWRHAHGLGGETNMAAQAPFDRLSRFLDRIGDPGTPFTLEAPDGRVRGSVGVSRGSAPRCGRSSRCPVRVVTANLPQGAITMTEPMMNLRESSPQNAISTSTRAKSAPSERSPPPR